MSRITLSWRLPMRFAISSGAERWGICVRGRQLDCFFEALQVCLVIGLHALKSGKQFLGAPGRKTPLSQLGDHIALAGQCNQAFADVPTHHCKLDFVLGHMAPAPVGSEPYSVGSASSRSWAAASPRF